MVTSRITNSKFHKRVQESIARARADARPTAHIDGLTFDEVNLRPGSFVSGIIGTVSPWIEIDSLDPIVAHAGKQVLELELAYAAFCGLGHVIVPGPRRQGDVAAFAQAISTALAHGTYMQLLVQLPVDDWAGDEGNSAENSSYDAFSSWDAWNTIRTVCKYSSQLTIGSYTPRLGLAPIDIYFSTPDPGETAKLVCRSPLVLGTAADAPHFFFHLLSEWQGIPGLVKGPPGIAH